MRFNTRYIYGILTVLWIFLYSDSSFAQGPNVKFSNNNITESNSGSQPKKIVPSMATWHMDSALIDYAAEYSPFKVLANLRSIARDKDIMTNSVHDQIKNRADYANQKGISLVADLDVRLAMPTFEAMYPDELQQSLVVKEIAINGPEDVTITMSSRSLQDHYQRSYPVRAGSFVKAFKYRLTPQGMVDPASLQEITTSCIVKSATKDSVQLELPATAMKQSSHVFFMGIFTYQYADVFAPHLIEFNTGILKKYADVNLAGAHYDEWGFPNTISEQAVKNEYWYTKYRAKAYAEVTKGRDLLNDILLMHRGIAGQESERVMAINYFQKMARTRNAQLEENLYDRVKEIFGKEAIVAVHPTWFPYPEKREFKKNGLDWWVVKRDWAQTDEVTPFGIRTALSKKWNSPVWYNMYYRFGTPQGYEKADDYLEELWSAALAGGRVSNLPHIGIQKILASDFVRAETRVRLLNYINPSPLNCPVAVIFGHASAMNWAGPNFEKLGMNLIDSLWRLGIAADLIPTSEIENKSLLVDKDGFIRYGKQQYAAAVLYHPEFENQGTATFFSQASKGKTQLYRVGDWTRDFEGRTLNGISLLPKALQTESNAKIIIKEVIQLLKDKNIPLNSPATRRVVGFGHLSYAPPTTGYSYLLDGTLVQVAATHNGAGDTIRSTSKIRKFDVSLDAIGVVGVRLDKNGNLEALAAGGFKSITTEKFKLVLDERVDLALWKNEKGAWEGLLQGWNGDIPAQLLSITPSWSRLDLPPAFPQKIISNIKKLSLAEGKNQSSSSEILTDIDNNTYQTIKVGNQVWMAENLRTSKYGTGELIAKPAGSNADWYSNRSGAYAWYENDSVKNENTTGKLYNWYALQNDNLCPTGWKAPNDNDWATLINYLESSTVKIDPAIKENASTAFFGFNPQSGGYRDQYGPFFESGNYGLWWSSTGTSKRAVWNQEKKLFYVIEDRAIPKGAGLSVRCIRK